MKIDRQVDALRRESSESCCLTKYNNHKYASGTIARLLTCWSHEDWDPPQHFWAMMLHVCAKVWWKFKFGRDFMPLPKMCRLGWLIYQSSWWSVLSQLWKYASLPEKMVSRTQGDMTPRILFKATNSILNPAVNAVWNNPPECCYKPMNRQNAVKTLTKLWRSTNAKIKTYLTNITFIATNLLPWWHDQRACETDTPIRWRLCITESSSAGRIADQLTLTPNEQSLGREDSKYKR